VVPLEARGEKRVEAAIFGSVTRRDAHLVGQLTSDRQVAGEAAGVDLVVQELAARRARVQPPTSGKEVGGGRIAALRERLDSQVPVACAALPSRVERAMHRAECARVGLQHPLRERFEARLGEHRVELFEDPDAALEIVEDRRFEQGLCGKVGEDFVSQTPREERPRLRARDEACPRGCGSHVGAEEGLRGRDLVVQALRVVVFERRSLCGECAQLLGVRQEEHSQLGRLFDGDSTEARSCCGFVPLSRELISTRRGVGA
jgi:hypothetical protein